MKNSFEERFWAKVQKRDNGCWEWIAGKNGWGYGQIRDGYQRRPAHRASYEMHYGRIQDDRFVCHRCDNPACVNPEHLFLGTHAENMADKVAKGRQLRGATHNLTKLSEADILAIRTTEGFTQQQLAERFGVVQSHISAIRGGRRWACLQGDGR